MSFSRFECFKISACSSDAAAVKWFFLLAYAVLLFWVIGSKAWLFEDVFITFRTVDNFVTGYGLRWNIDERVQTFTHPLWMLLHIPLYAMTHNMFFSSLLLCFVCSIMACMLTLYGLSRQVSLLVLGVTFVVPLLLSRTFQIYATSGFESPLTILLFALVCYEVLVRNPGKVNGLWLALLVALSGFNRLDTLILYIPLLGYLAWQAHWKLPWKKLLIGFSPLIAWELFSLFYYGFLFPNTKYAKLGTGFTTWEYLQQGWAYWLDLCELDAISACVIVLGVVSSIFWGIEFLRSRGHKRPALAMLGLGSLLYVLYVVRIGGDHMSYRHWFVSLFTCLVLLHYWALDMNEAHRTGWLRFLAAILLLCFCVHQAFLPYEDAQKRGIARGSYNTGRSLSYMMSMIRNNSIEYPYWTDQATQIRAELAASGERRLFRYVIGIGILGFYAGSEVLLADKHALADALLARLPLSAEQKQASRPGHFIRSLPDGYEQARMYGDYSQMNPDIAEYYLRLRIIGTYPLFNWERIKTIVLFNLGYYDKYRDKFLELYPDRPVGPFPVYGKSAMLVQMEEYKQS